MTYRENSKNVNTMNTMNTMNSTNNTPVNLISSTYDPSRQMSYMNQSLKNTPKINTLPPTTASYPQPSKNIQIPIKQSPNSQFPIAQPSNTLDSQVASTLSALNNNHPSQSSMKPLGLPVHPNSGEGQQIRNMQMQNAQTAQIKKDNLQDTIIQKVSDKIYNHFKIKYPATIDASGFNKTTVVTIVTHSIKKEPLNEKSISKIIDIIDYKFKNTINSDNRQGVQYDTTNFSIDTESKISIDKYLENYTNKVSILVDSDRAIEADLPKKMSPLNDIVKITPPEPFSEEFPIRDREKNIDMMIPEVREYDYYIVVNSNDRNIIKSPDPDSFTIEFAPAPSGDSQTQTGYIDRSFSNIKSCEIINVTFLDTSNIATSTDGMGIKYPYLLLQFDELQSNYYGTNINLSKTFAILTDYITTGNYRYYKIFGELGDKTVSKVYNPRINLSKLTTRILLPDGSPFNFGTENTNDTSNSCITFGFRITTIQKNLGTSFMKHA
jgi:hypothetical protein